MRHFFSHRSSNRPRRKGAAAVELAVASPVIVLMLMGTIDLGQFINISEVISNASRIGARKAVRFETKNVSEVETAVVDHLANHFVMVSRETLSNATTVTIRNAGGTEVTGTGIQNFSEMQDVIVEVSFDYSAIRWVSLLGMLDGQTLKCTTTMRHL